MQLPHDAAKTAELLTMLGLEVDAVEPMPLAFQGVVVGKVLSSKPHPEADKLQVAVVSDGQEEFQVVCGAPNCREGILTAFAKVGARLTDSDGKQFKIKKGKLRGVESFGMLCGADELGLDSTSDGILELPVDTEAGQDLADIYGDEIFDISLTPNLGHCTSLRGILRELSAVTGLSFGLPRSLVADEQAPSITEQTSVKIEDSDGCPRYACRLIRNVKVGPSPQWMQRRLEQCGLRPVNNVVDVTNYVLLELGHPLHAFDLEKLAEQRIVVRRAKRGEKLKTLDDLERSLTEEDLVICDASHPIALAGIMGGASTEVTDSTTAVLLESAFFDPRSVRKSSKRLGLSTEASKRFERSADPNAVLGALNRAAALIHDLAGGEIANGAIDCKQNEFTKKTILCRHSRICSLIGQHFAVSEVESIFKRLEFTTDWDSQDTFTVQIPTYRADIHAEIDLIEEVARIYGYDNIECQGAYYEASSLSHAPIFLLEQQARKQLLAEGLSEFITCDLIGPSALQAVGADAEDPQSAIHVLNPVSVEQSTLRQSLLPGLLQSVKHNIDRGSRTVAAFEVGRIHRREGDGYKEQSVAGIILAGSRAPSHWSSKAEEYDFFDAKGYIEGLLEGLAMPTPSFQRSELPSLHPGRQANIFIGAVDVGAVGELHPEVQRRIDCKQRIYFAEVNLHDLFQLQNPAPVMEQLPQFPGMDRDWTVTLSAETRVASVFDAIRKNAPVQLEQVQLLDLFEDDAKLGKGLKNCTFRFYYRDLKKTLKQEEIEKRHTGLVKRVAEELGDAVHSATLGIPNEGTS